MMVRVRNLLRLISVSLFLSGSSLMGFELHKSVYFGDDGGLSCPGTDTLSARSGDLLTYCYAVTNGSGGVLVNATLQDPLLPGFFPVDLGDLSDGAFTSYSFAAEFTAPITNLAEVSAINTADQVVAVTDTAAVSIIYPGIAMSKTVYLGHDGGGSCPGRKNIQGPQGTNVTYCFIVGNVGDAVLTNVVLSDDDLAMTPIMIGQLLPGEQVTNFFEATLDDDLVNTAEVLGEDPNGQPAVFSDSASVAFAGEQSAFCLYTIQDLGTLGGADGGAFALNDYGDVVGWSRNSNGYIRGFLYTYTNETMIDLGVFGGNEGVARSINNQRHVTGVMDVDSNGNRAAFFYADGVKSNLGTLGGPASIGWDINNNDAVAGLSSPNSSITNRAFLWTNGVMVNLGTVGPATSEAHALNDNGRVVGFGHLSPLNEPATLFQPFTWFDYDGDGLSHPTNEFTFLGTLGGQNGVAQDINNAGVIVGGADTGVGFRRNVFMVSPDANTNYWVDSDTNGLNDLMQNLGTLGGQKAEAWSINEAGTVVGWGQVPLGTYEALIYSGGVLTNLNVLLPSTTTWTLVHATGINESGQICGRGQIAGVDRPFLMTPCDISVQITDVYELPLDGTNREMFVRWQGVGQPMEYTLEKASSITSTNWYPAPPTNEWPKSDSFWSGIYTQDQERFLYRVRGHITNPVP